MSYEKDDEEDVDTTDYPYGYRAWDIRWIGGEPRLGALVTQKVWEPDVELGEDPATGELVPVRIVKSDFPYDHLSEEEQKKRWKEFPWGLHFLKSLKDVEDKFPGRDIYGALQGYGAVEGHAPGYMGYRVHKARVAALYRKVIPCYVCMKPAKFFLHNDERYPLCENHLKMLENKADKAGWTKDEVEAVLEKLADIYQSDLEYYPEGLD